MNLQTDDGSALKYKLFYSLADGVEKYLSDTINGASYKGFISEAGDIGSNN